MGVATSDHMNDSVRDDDVDDDEASMAEGGTRTSGGGAFRWNPNEARTLLASELD